MSFGYARSVALLRWLPLLLIGCLPGLDRYSVGDDGGVRRDTGRRDAAGVDGGPPPGCGPAPTCASGCPQPWLLAAVEDLPGGDSCGGMVMRWSLTDRENACVCTPLVGDAMFPEQPLGLGFVPPSTVVVASEGGTAIAIDGQSDSELWRSPVVGQPRDVFALEDPGGTMLAAVAMGDRGVEEIRRVHLINASTGIEQAVRRTNGDLPVGLGVYSMTYSPVDRTWLRALKVNGGYAAADVDPWNDMVIDDPPHTTDRESFFLETISAFYYDETYRTTWTGRRTDGVEVPSAVFDYRSSTLRVDNRVPLGERCNRG